MINLGRFRLNAPCKVIYCVMELCPFKIKGFLSNLPVEAIVIAGVEADAEVCKLWMYVLP